MRVRILLAAMALAAACNKTPEPESAAPVPETPPETTGETTAPADTADATPAVSCAEAHARLDSLTMPDDMHQRALEGDVAKLGGPEWPDIVQAPPSGQPAELATLNTSAVCNLVFDIDETGTARTPQAQCSDPAFESFALQQLGETRFEPYTLNGRDLPVSGVLMPMEFCPDA